MGKRGPQPGFKKARELAAAAASAPSSLLAKTTPAAKRGQAAKPTADKAAPTAPSAPITPIALSAADRENPEKLSGQALRELAHRRGLAKSILATMPDEKIRMELRYIVNRQYSDDALA